MLYSPVRDWLLGRVAAGEGLIGIAPAGQSEITIEGEHQWLCKWRTSARLRSGWSRTSSRVIVGKHYEVQLALIALICRGHLLIEDVPGVGKTTLAKSLARSLGCTFKRMQFTPDLLPSDVTGVSIYNQKRRGVRVPARPGHGADRARR